MFSVLHTVLGVILSQVVGLSSSIVLSVKISRTALLAAYIAELGVRYAKGPSDLGKTLNSFFLRVFDMLKIF